MSSETTIGREPVQFVELEQPRCALTYGTAPCTAEVGTTGSRKCFNTRKTCQDSANYDGSDLIVWRFMKPMAQMPLDLYDEDGGDIYTNPIPSLVSVSTSPTRINIGGGSEDASPLGRRASVSIVLVDHVWDDSIEDKYLSERDYVPIERGTFWSKWLARNPYHGRLNLRVVEGYRGQAYADMQKRSYIVERIDGPDASGRVTITAKDPLRLADAKRTQFPRTSDIVLDDTIADNTTAGITLTCAQTELTDAFGNTGATRYLRIGNEILEYTGVSGSGTTWDLTGVTRGALGTTAEAHDSDEKCQRVGRYDSLEVWNIVEDLLLNHTSLPSAFIDTSQWDTEGNAYLLPFTLTATVAQPTPVATLLGELTEQCPFYLWWDERDQTIPIRAVRPPLSDGVRELNDNEHILAGSAILTEDPTQRISRIYLYYDQKDPTKSLTDVGNYRSVRGRIDANAESDAEHGEVRVRQIFSRWLTTSGQAIQTTVRVLNRLRDQVQFLSVKVDAKDRDIKTADVLDVTTRVVVDDTGAEVPTRWQVISEEEIVPGEVMRYDMQRFTFFGRLWRWADESAPDYDVATEQEREDNAYFADDDGKVEGDYGYQWG